MPYSRLSNPSPTHTMLATIQHEGGPTSTYRVPPKGAIVPGEPGRATGYIPVHGPIRWHLWTLEFEPPPRKGLMRFGR